MKRAAMILAALAAILTAVAAPVRTATENFVTNKIEEIRTNTYTRAETDARIGELAPRTSLAPATNYTDEVAAYKRGVKDLAVYGGYAPWKIWNDDHEMAWNEGDNGWSISAEDYGSDRWLSWSDGVWTLRGNLDSGESFAYCTNGFFAMRLEFGSEVLWRTSIYVTNGAHIVTSEDIAPSVSNIVTKAFVEGLGIESGIQEETDPTVPQWAKAPTKPTYTASEVGALGNTGEQTIVGESSDHPYFRIGFDATWPWLEFGEFNGAKRVYSPHTSGTLAVLSDIAVKSVKLNGTALTPDADGAVDVQAATPDNIPPAVSNIVTTALVRERLGVYLYVGADGGIYVHTNED